MMLLSSCRSFGQSERYQYVPRFSKILCFLAAMLCSPDIAMAEGGQDPQTLAIIKDLSSGNAEQRKQAAQAAKELPSKGKDVVDALTAALIKEDIHDNKIAIMEAISVFGAAAAPSLWAIDKQLDSDETLEAAVTTIALVGQEAPYSGELAKLTPRLMKLLEHPNAEVKYTSIFVLQKIGPAALAAVPSLVKTSEDPAARVRWVSLATLAVLLAKGPEVTEAAARRLKDADQKVRSAAAFFMGALQGGAPETAARSLVLALQAESDREVRVAMISAFGSLLPEGEKVAVPQLEAAIRGNHPTQVKQACIAALGEIGKAAEASIPTLLFALTNGSPAESHQAARAVAKISTAANVVDALVDATRDGRGTVRAAAALALGSIGPVASARGVPALTVLAAEAVPEARMAAVRALGMMGPAAQSSLAVLTTRLGDTDEIKKAAGRSIANIINSIRDTRDASSIELLRSALGKMTPHRELKDDTESVRRAIEYLELTWWFQLTEGAKQFATTYRLYVGVALAAAVWLLICTILHIFRPLWLLRLNEVLSPLDFNLPGWLGGGKIPVRSLTLIKLFAIQPRTLDAWVHNNIGSARKQFEKIPAVQERQVHIDLPTVINGRTVSGLQSSDLRSAFQSNVTCILITGEGGAGKTSFAAALGKCAMNAAREERLAPHLMIPIWIENDLPSQSGTSDPLLEMTRRNLQFLIGVPELPPLELVRRLLVHKRLLVIVDRFSELGDKTREIIKPSSPTFLPNCMVITSRWKERFGNVDVTVLEPLRVAGNRLSSFMEAYLMQRQKRDMFTDPEFFATCGRLSDIVQGRTVTVLFAKLFAEESIRQKEAGSNSIEVRNLPHLVASYIAHINEALGESRLEMSLVQKSVKIIAWKCIEAQLAPSEAKVAEVLTALGEDGAARLEYFENRLRLVKRVEPEFDSIRFSLDPLAEYLAASYLVERARDKVDFWIEIVRRLKESSEISKRRGFIRALFWYCKEAMEDNEMPASLFEDVAMIRREAESDLPNQQPMRFAPPVADKFREPHNPELEPRSAPSGPPIAALGNAAPPSR